MFRQLLLKKAGPGHSRSKTSSAQASMGKPHSGLFSALFVKNSNMSSWRYALPENSYPLAAGSIISHLSPIQGILHEHVNVFFFMSDKQEPSFMQPVTKQPYETG